MLSEVYNSIRLDLGAQLESQFNTAFMYGNYQLAYDTFGKLMEYQLLDHQDDRLEPSNIFLSTIRKEKIADKEHRFARDYRRDKNFLGTWLYHPLKRGLSLVLNGNAYVQETTNGEYKSQSIFGERKHEVTMFLMGTSKQAENSIEDIGKIYEHRYKKTFVTPDDYKLATDGIIRIYKLEFTSGMPNYYKTLGFIVIAPTEQGLMGLVVFKTATLKKYHIDIQSTYNAIVYELETAGGLSGVQFMPWCDISRYPKEQKEERNRQYQLISKLQA